MQYRPQSSLMICHAMSRLLIETPLNVKVCALVYNLSDFVLKTNCVQRLNLDDKVTLFNAKLWYNLFIYPNNYTRTINVKLIISIKVIC